MQTTVLAYVLTAACVIVATPTWRLETYYDKECIDLAQVIEGNDTTVCEGPVYGIWSTKLFAQEPYKLWTWHNEHCVQRAFNLVDYPVPNFNCAESQPVWGSWQVTRRIRR